MIADRLTKADPANAGWQARPSVLHDNIGDVQVAQGNLPRGARRAMRASAAI